MTLDLLAEYEELVRQHVAEKKTAEALGLSPLAAVVHGLLRRALPDASDKHVLALTRDMADALDGVLFAGWEERADATQGARKAMLKVIAHDDTARPLATSGFVDEALAAIAAL
jgi:hypothetical protein